MRTLEHKPFMQQHEGTRLSFLRGGHNQASARPDARGAAP